MIAPSTRPAPLESQMRLNIRVPCAQRLVVLLLGTLADRANNSGISVEGKAAREMPDMDETRPREASDQGQGPELPTSA